MWLQVKWLVLLLVVLDEFESDQPVEFEQLAQTILNIQAN